MATRQSIENIIEKAENVLSEAKDQLNVANRNGYEINESYDRAQRHLSNLDAEINKLMDSANHQQREQLHRLHLQVSAYLNDMILDQTQLFD
ncbi:hypothetical protein Pryu01_02792 [Paraliobacillus ryukyuensis]|uniref:Uncharacterized protein DUF2524 n=1 Tax=Paraliobacillus ryukyuensis TaxID=200904 RepID=A0A366E6Z7_9BACI|nr:DUF2524 family protein [Paraliobacillus ryukyuensis]RBO98140.1 uncharacterized protein DUF2524 [Paraliobacillus ryukyuensis]